MAWLKGQEVGGYVQIGRNVDFKGAVKYSTPWNPSLFVDFDGGNDGHDGQSEANAFQNPKKALDTATAGTNIYFKPSFAVAQMVGGDPGLITPATAANWEIGTTQYGLSLIGCGTPHKGMKATVLKGYAGVAAPVLDIKAPLCNIENLGFKKGTSGTSMVRSKYTDAVRYGWKNTIYNCWFRLAGADGAVSSDAAWYDSVEQSVFSSCLVGILFSQGNEVAKGNYVADCDFEGLATEIDADILSGSTMTRALFTRLTFNHPVPSGGSNAKYIKIGAASTGLFSDSYVNEIDATVADHFTLNGIGYAHIYVSVEGLVVAA